MPRANLVNQVEVETLRRQLENLELEGQNLGWDWHKEARVGRANDDYNKHLDPLKGETNEGIE